MYKSACSIKMQSSPKLSMANTQPSPWLADKHLLFHLPIFLPSKQNSLWKLFGDKSDRLRARMVGRYIFRGHEMIPSRSDVFDQLESYMWRKEITILAWKYFWFKSSLLLVSSSKWAAKKDESGRSLFKCTVLKGDSKTAVHFGPKIFSSNRSLSFQKIVPFQSFQWPSTLDLIYLYLRYLEH